MGEFDQSLAAWDEKNTFYGELTDQFNNKIDEYHSLVESGNADSAYLEQLRAEVYKLKSQREALEAELIAEDAKHVITKKNLLERDRNLDNTYNVLTSQIDKLFQDDGEIKSWASRRDSTHDELSHEQQSVQELSNDLEAKTAQLAQLQSRKQEIENRLREEASPENFIVPRGQFTFDAEGKEGGPYHSRKPQVPSANSGLTIGRGYDLKERTSAEVISDLKNAGLSEADAISYSRGVGLTGDAARNFGTNLCEITPLQQKNLFINTYNFMENDCVRICNKPDVVERYGATNWNDLNQKIKDIVIDLRFRGDYNPTTRELIQPLIVSNNFDGFSKILSDRNKWTNVPLERFSERVKYLQRLTTRILLASAAGARFANANARATVPLSTLRKPPELTMLTKKMRFTFK